MFYQESGFKAVVFNSVSLASIASIALKKLKLEGEKIS